MSSYFDNKPVFMEPKVEQYSSHMIMSNVSQEIKTKIVNIDTKFRDDYEFQKCSVIDYSVTMPESINNVCSMTVENVELPISYYNISSALGNNYFKVTRTNTQESKIITIPDGEYNLTELKDKINQVIDTHTGFEGLTFDILNHKIRFYVDNNTEEYILYFAVNNDGSFDKFNMKSKIGWLLGFTKISYDTSDPNLSQGYTVGDKLPDLHRPKILYLYIDDFSQTKQNSFVTMMSRSRNSHNIIGKIMVDRATNGFQTLFLANKANGYLLSDVRKYNGKADISKLQIQLFDEFDRKIDLNGLDFSLSLKFDYM
tara:strand:+ start:4324 stop:5262 length:939 start_codon:yes stop_codon:yes gene_type:complete